MINHTITNSVSNPVNGRRVRPVVSTRAVRAMSISNRSLTETASTAALAGPQRRALWPDLAAPVVSELPVPVSRYTRKGGLGHIGLRVTLRCQVAYDAKRKDLSGCAEFDRRAEAPPSTTEVVRGPTVSHLFPRPVTSGWDWQLSAACRGLGDELFYGPPNERGRYKRRREQAAKNVCATCPVIDPCLAWALSMGETYGVWGGLTVEERANLTTGEDRAAMARPDMTGTRGEASR
jgi:WhiB family redox-sensing transcriptional regulator